MKTAEDKTAEIAELIATARHALVRGDHQTGLTKAHRLVNLLASVGAGRRNDDLASARSLLHEVFAQSGAGADTTNGICACLIGWTWRLQNKPGIAVSWQRMAGKLLAKDTDWSEFNRGLAKSTTRQSQQRSPELPRRP